MKNPIAKDNGSDRYDGEVFVVKRLEGEAKSKYKETLVERERFAKFVMPPRWVQILIAFALFVGVVLVSIGLEIIPEGGLTSEAERTAITVLLSVGIPLAVAGGAGVAYIAVHARKISRSSEYKEFEERDQRRLASFREELGVPDTAVPVDALGQSYSVKNGKIKYEAPSAKRVFENRTVYLFSDSEALYLAEEDALFRFPLTGTLRLAQDGKTKTFYGWNKEEAYNKGSYKPYKIRLNDSGAYYAKKSVLLQTYCDGEDYELAFPAYEGETVMRLTGRTL